jgi:hypothetical protein
VSGAATIGFVFFLDRGKTIIGAAAQAAQRIEIKSIRESAAPEPSIPGAAKAG